MSKHWSLYRTAGTVLICTAISYCLSFGTVYGAEVETDPTPHAKTSLTSRIVATGRGKPPRKAVSKAQQKLMAKRAAMLEAYKNMAKALGDVRSNMVEGTGYETVDGFIKGVELSETRYYENGEVEVDIELIVSTQGGPEELREPPIEQPPTETKLLLVEKGGGKISETEWRQIHKMKSPVVP